MSNRAVLTIDDRTWEIRQYNYSFYQHVDPDTNKTTSKIFGGLIDISLETTRADSTIVEIMLLPLLDDISGTIKINDEKKDELRRITFDDAAITSYSESYSSGDGTLIQSFTISCRSLEVNGHAFKL